MKPTVRFDPTTNEWISFAPRRSGRPQTFGAARATLDDKIDACPFCPGHEQQTTTELLRIGNGDAWRVRAFSNLYPAFGDSEGAGSTVDSSGLFREAPSSGAHEVVVESPDHFHDLRTLLETQVEDLLRALHARYCALSARPGMAAIVPFKNHGPSAGTSLRHPHWQIIGTSVVPPLLERKREIARAYFRETGQSLYADLLRAEQRAMARIVESDASYVALAPFASQTPFHVRILPRVPRASWSELSVEALFPLAWLLPNILRRLDGLLGDPSFNITVTCAPLGERGDPSFSWHLDILPRTTTDGGFELGGGMKINTVLPEEAAAALRSRG